MRRLQTLDIQAVYTVELVTDYATNPLGYKAGCMEPGHRSGQVPCVHTEWFGPYESYSGAKAFASMLSGRKWKRNVAPSNRKAFLHTAHLNFTAAPEEVK